MKDQHTAAASIKNHSDSLAEEREAEIRKECVDRIMDGEEVDRISMSTLLVDEYLIDDDEIAGILAMDRDDLIAWRDQLARRVREKVEHWFDNSPYAEDIVSDIYREEQARYGDDQ